MFPNNFNEGYCTFQVDGISTAPAASSVRLSTTLSEDIEYILSIIHFPKMQYNDKDSWVDFFNAYVKDTTGPFSMKVEITNEMDYTIPNVEFCSFFYDKDLWEGEHIPYTTTSYSEHMTLFPHETYSLEITVDAETADKMRAAGLGNVWCDLTYHSGLLNVVYEAVYGHPYRGEIPDGDNYDTESEDIDIDYPDGSFDIEGGDSMDIGSFLGSSGGGCNSGISVLCPVILLAALIIRRKTR